MLQKERVGKIGTAWKFTQWAPDARTGIRRLKWADGIGEIRGPLETDRTAVEGIYTDMAWNLNNLTDEGESDLADVYFDDTAVRANTYARFYNDTLIEAETLSTAQNEMSGNGYGALTYARGTDWTVSGSVATGATKTLTASGGSIGPFTDMGLATVATGTSGLLIAYVALSQSRTLADGESLDVTPTVTVS